MANPSTLHRFKIQLSDVSRDVYQLLELRVARHPSESMPYLLTRILAYALNVQEGLAFSDGGLSAPDVPALSVRDLTGSVTCWIEVGSPSARRLHKASKASRQLRVYQYRDFALFEREIAGEEIFRREEIEFYVIEPQFLEALGKLLERDNKWELLHTDGELTITAGDRTVQGEIAAHRLSSAMR